MRTLYHSGTILTMEDALPEAEILVVCDGKIEYVGNRRNEYFEICDTVIDLEGKCLMPAFIDAHSHFLSLAVSSLQVSLKDTSSLAEIEAHITEFIQNNRISSGKWVNAVGYDQTTLPDHQHPSRAFLDRICPENPLILQHVSGHMGVLNTQALKALNMTEQTVCAPGGHIDMASGLLQETAFVECLKQIPAPDFQALLDACVWAQKQYASYGIVTVQEGMLVKEMIPLYQALLASGILKLDIVAFASHADADAVYAAFDNTYEHFHLGGCKIFLDGSPQGGTAWMRTPYQGSDRCGSGTMTDADVLSAARTAAANGRQLLAHCNGDAACGQFISALEQAAADYPNLPKTRPVLIHAQLIGRDQLRRVKAVGGIVSFFVSHVYHWGDIHIRNFGLPRASAISPARSALKYGVPITFHTDAPVISPNLLEAVGCAVCRTTKKGVLLDDGESVSVNEALKAVTINCAYQYFLEDTTGSLKAGKSADLVILDRAPGKTAPKDIKNIRVIETIKAGARIYLRA